MEQSLADSLATLNSHDEDSDDETVKSSSGSTPRISNNGTANASALAMPSPIKPTADRQKMVSPIDWGLDSASSALCAREPLGDEEEEDRDEDECGVGTLSNEESLPLRSTLYKKPREKKGMTGASPQQRSYCSEEKRADRIVFAGVWRIGSKIGKGSSGIVKEAWHLPTNHKCVVKCVRRHREPLTTPEGVNKDGISHREHFFLREAMMGVLLDHPNIIKLHSFYMGINHFYFFFEHIEGQDLADYVADMGRLEEDQARIIFSQIVSAILYVHRNHVIHRDLKLENIRISSNSHITILDFGYATFISDKFNQASSCGSPCYAAPEIYCEQEYRGPEVDIWSLGVCLYSMCVGLFPFDKSSLKELSVTVKKGDVTYPAFLSADAVDLISSMLKVNSKYRYNIEQVASHRWMKANKSDSQIRETVSSQQHQPEIRKPLPNGVPQLLPYSNSESKNARWHPPHLTSEWIDAILGIDKHERGEVMMMELEAYATSRAAALEAEWEKAAQFESYREMGCARTCGSYQGTDNRRGSILKLERVARGWRLTVGVANRTFLPIWDKIGWRASTVRWRGNDSDVVGSEILPRDGAAKVTKWLRKTGQHLRAKFRFPMRLGRAINENRAPSNPVDDLPFEVDGAENDTDDDNQSFREIRCSVKSHKIY